MNNNEQNTNNVNNINNQNNNINTNQNNYQGMVNNQQIPVVPVINEINVNQPQQLNDQNQNKTGELNTNPSNQMPPLQEVKIEEPKKGSNFKYIMTFLLFVLLFAVVLFLPDISEYINIQKAKQAEKNNVVVITTGTLKCKLSDNDSNFDYSYIALFDFKDSKLTKLTYTSETKGDRNLDEEELAKLNNSCNDLVEYTKTYDGVAVNCSLKAGTFTKKQIFNYNEINEEEVTATYVEAGGIYPDYSLNQNIDEIERNMKNSDYDCERIK